MTRMMSRVAWLSVAACLLSGWQVYDETMTDRVDQLKKLLAAEPNDPFCLYSLAQEYAKREEYVQAVEWYDRALAADPDYHYAYFHKAKALEAQDQVLDACTTLRLGIDRARAAGEQHALSELMGYLDELS